MAGLLETLLSSGLNAGVLGLSSLLGSHTNASSNAQTYLTIIMAASDNPSTVRDQASLLASTLATTDPLSAALALNMRNHAENPALVLQLCNQIAQNIAQHNSSIMSNLSAVVAGATQTGNTSLATAASQIMVNRALGG
jgi:hypothetical protein